MFKVRLQETNGFEGFLSREEKEKSEQQLDCGRLTDPDLLGRANDNYAKNKEELKRLKSQREQFQGQSTVAEKRRSYKELILGVLQYWNDEDVYPPEDLIPTEELPMIIDTFVEKVILDTLSPRFYRIAIHWRDPQWGIDVMACFRAGNPSVRWTDEEKVVIREHYATSSREELMRLLPGRSYTGIHHKASRLDITKMYTRNVEDLPLNLGLQDYEIAGQLGVTESTLAEEGRYIEIAGAKLVSRCEWYTRPRARNRRENGVSRKRNQVSSGEVSSVWVCQVASRYIYTRR